MKRVAFVVQRCGAEVNGGAELHCLQVAQRMSRHWQTEVLTTCALDYMTWDNFYPAGVVDLGGVALRRFPVDQSRDVESFNRLSAEMHSRQQATTVAEQEEWMRAQGPCSSALLDYIAAEADNYSAFIFFGYLYATTYFGLPLVREKAFLAPLAHDEWPIYFSMWEKLFTLPRRLIFNTYGPRMRLRDGRVVPAFIGQALSNTPLTIFGDGSQTRSFCFVSDLIDGIFRLSQSDFHEPVNIGNPREMTIKQFAEEIRRITGTKAEIEHRPLPVDDPKVRQPDIGRARKILGWEPRVDFEQGITETIEYFRGCLERGMLGERITTLS